VKNLFFTLSLSLFSLLFHHLSWLLLENVSECSYYMWVKIGQFYKKNKKQTNVRFLLTIKNICSILVVVTNKK